MRKRLLQIVGCGPGGTDYLTGQAHKAVAEAEVVIGTPKFLQLFPLSGTRVELDSVNTEKVAGLVAGLDAFKVAVLVSGDTGLYSLASPLRKALQDRWEVRFVPGISSVQAACALFCMEWQDMRFFSLHFRPAPLELVEAAGQGKQPVAILCGPANRPDQVARQLLILVEPERKCYVAFNLGSENQQIWSGKLSELAKVDLEARAVCIIDRRTT